MSRKKYFSDRQPPNDIPTDPKALDGPEDPKIESQALFLKFIFYYHISEFNVIFEISIV